MWDVTGKRKLISLVFGLCGLLCGCLCGCTGSMPRAQSESVFPLGIPKLENSSDRAQLKIRSSLGKTKSGVYHQALKAERPPILPDLEGPDLEGPDLEIEGVKEAEMVNATGYQPWIIEN